VFVCILPGKAVPEMTYTVSGGTLNPTHSLTHVNSLQGRIVTPLQCGGMSDPMWQVTLRSSATGFYAQLFTL